MIVDKYYDSQCKRLFHNNPEAFLKLFEPDAIFLQALPEGLELVHKPGEPNEEAQSVDCLTLAMIDELETLVLIEWQTHNDYQMGDRLLEYNRRIREKHGQTALPCVIYLLKDGNEPPSPLIMWAGRFQVIRLDFRSIHVGDWQAENLLARSDVDLLPLLPFTIGGRDIRLVKRMLERLRQEGSKLLLDIGIAFAEYAFDHYHGDLEWFHREVDNMKEMRDLPLFKAWREEGREEERAEAYQRELAAARSLLIEIVEARMPHLKELAQEQADLIDKPEILRTLTIQLAVAQTSKQAERSLRNWNKPTKKKSAE